MRLFRVQQTFQKIHCRVDPYHVRQNFLQLLRPGLRRATRMTDQCDLRTVACQAGGCTHREYGRRSDLHVSCGRPVGESREKSRQ